MAGVGLAKHLGIFLELCMETYDPNKNKTEVRQANPRKMNLRVLMISLVLIIIAFAAIFIIFQVMQPAQP
jgi:hypothetical protein